MNPLNSHPEKPSFSEKIKQELKGDEGPKNSYTLIFLLFLLLVAVIFFLVALAKGCGKEEVKTTTPAAQPSTEEEQLEESTETTGETTEPTGTEGEAVEGQTYEVQSGDTLSTIGNEFGVDWKKIAEVNNLSEPYDLQVGQKLIIPPKESGAE
jgi:hypothetical protein